MTLFEPQSLAAGLAFIHFLSATFARTKRLHLVKNERRLWKFSRWEVPTQKITVTVIYISFKNLLTQTWPNMFILPQFSKFHNETKKFASNMQRSILQRAAKLVRVLYKWQRITNVRGLLLLIFAVNRWECLQENKT